MKAKEYYLLLCEGNDLEQVKSKIDLILSGFIKEMKNLIKIRHAKSNGAILSIIKELNNKWVSLVAMTQKKPEVLHTYEISDINFIKYINNNPEFKKFIPPQHDQKLLNQNSTSAPLYMHKVIPLEEITLENITHEFLSCKTAFRCYTQNNISPEFLKPLKERISFLEYWRTNGINLDEIEDFKKDRKKFLTNKNIKEKSYYTSIYIRNDLGQMKKSTEISLKIIDQSIIINYNNSKDPLPQEILNWLKSEENPIFFDRTIEKYLLEMLERIENDNRNMVKSDPTRKDKFFMRDNYLMRDIYKACCILYNIRGCEKSINPNNNSLLYWIQKWQHIETCWENGHSEYC